MPVRYSHWFCFLSALRLIFSFYILLSCSEKTRSSSTSTQVHWIYWKGFLCGKKSCFFHSKLSSDYEYVVWGGFLSEIIVWIDVSYEITWLNDAITHKTTELNDFSHAFFKFNADFMKFLNEVNETLLCLNLLSRVLLHYSIKILIFWFCWIEWVVLTKISSKIVIWIRVSPKNPIHWLLLWDPTVVLAFGTSQHFKNATFAVIFRIILIFFKIFSSNESIRLRNALV